MQITVNSTNLPNYNQNIKFGLMDLKKQRRTAGGKLQTDIKAQKRIFNVSYKWLYTADMNILITLKELQSNLTLEYDDETESTQTHTVFMSDLQYEEYKAYPGSSTWIYKSVTVTFEEV